MAWRSTRRVAARRAAIDTFTVIPGDRGTRPLAPKKEYVTDPHDHKHEDFNYEIPRIAAARLTPISRYYAEGPMRCAVRRVRPRQ